MKANDVLKRAQTLMSGDRQRTHGDKRENMDNITQLWAAYLDIRPDGPLKPYEVPILNALQKIARTCLGEWNLDDYVDAAAYLAIAAELSEPDKSASNIIKSVDMPELASVEAKTRA